MNRNVILIALLVVATGLLIQACTHNQSATGHGTAPAPGADEDVAGHATPPPGTEELWIIERFEGGDGSDRQDGTSAFGLSSVTDSDGDGIPDQASVSGDGAQRELPSLREHKIPWTDTVTLPDPDAWERHMRGRRRSELLNASRRAVQGRNQEPASEYPLDPAPPLQRRAARRPPATSTVLSSTLSGLPRGRMDGPQGAYVLTVDRSANEERQRRAARRELAFCSSFAASASSGGCIAHSDVLDPVPIPLEHTDVTARVAGSLATVAVRQEFSNPYDTKIEAVYVFPLPHDAAVHEFVMTIGDRRIRGILREREEAQRLYADARRAGKVASLMTQERPNVFTQKVANIEPGRSIDVAIEYFHTLPYKDGWYELAFPMVVGPRYNPAGTTNGVGATPRTQPNASGQATSVPYLAPHERSGHDIALRVELDAGTEIEELACDTHEISTNYADAPGSRVKPSRATVALAPTDRIPNRDFVLRWRVGGDTLRTAWIASGDAREGTFALTLYPPRTAGELPRLPVELICVVDTSGSMRGEPLEIAKSALHRLLDSLQPEDAFQIIRFSSGTSSLGRDLVPATEANLERGRAYVDRLSTGGGTRMLKGIRAALRYERDPLRRTVIAFLTDGYIGNEDAILAEVQEHVGDARIFSFGVGTSTNRYLLEGLAREGRGTAAFVGLNPRGGEIMADAFDRMCRPALAQVELDFGDLDVTDVYPARVPDLFPGRSVVVTGRYTNPTGSESATARVRGRLGRQQTAFATRCDLAAQVEGRAGVERLWARARIADLASEARSAKDAFDREACYELIKETALEHGLMSAFTAFVAVDSLSQTAGDEGVSVKVPVPVPAGVRYETTVGR